jgi:ECF sigma factor
MSDVTRILDRVQQGDPKAAGELLPLVYQELRKLAAARMAQMPPGQTLQPTALVHEAWLRLTGPEGQDRQWNSRGHFFAAAAEAMRQIPDRSEGPPQAPSPHAPWPSSGLPRKRQSCLATLARRPHPQTGPVV